MATLPTGVNLPGFTPPAAPGNLQGAPQPSASERAAIEAMWLSSLRAPLAAIIALLEAHPELVAWAKGSEAGTLRTSR